MPPDPTPDPRGGKRQFGFSRARSGYRRAIRWTRPVKTARKAFGRRVALSSRAIVRHAAGTTMETEQQATLCFILKNDQILLIRKKRGIGKGKINGPGGKVDPGETFLEAAVRETREEVGVTPVNPEPARRTSLPFCRGSDGTLSRLCVARLRGRITGNGRGDSTVVPGERSALRRDVGGRPSLAPILLEGKRFRGSVNVEGEESVAQQIEVLPD